MATRATVNVASTDVTPKVIPLSIRADTFIVSFMLYPLLAGVKATVEVTMDDVQKNPNTTRWAPLEDFKDVALDGPTTGNIAAPVTGVRFKTSVGGMTVDVIQAGNK